MKKWMSHFVYNSAERNGIFLLILIIIALQIIYFSSDFISVPYKQSIENERTASAIQQQIDSLKEVALGKNTVRIYPFNPNFLTDYKGYSLGMTPTEIDKLLNHRKQDKWVNSAEEFQKVTGVSDALLKEIKVYFEFPDFKKSKKYAFSKAKKPAKSFEQKNDLNTVSTEDLKQINGIGEVLARRIVSYRTKIGGFVNDLQLKDIYGLNYENRNKITADYTVKTSNSYQKIDINKATLLQLSEVVYFDYELAREIIDYRLLNEKIGSFEELAKIKNFPADKIDRIKLYLTID
ncbi:MAG TPA: helix-hairpin-helix domain-containing protein [Salinimicrobium sp.]|nr:helix-hairpin-helix domain-containing protein [Salinimicrobium sp.]